MIKSRILLAVLFLSVLQFLIISCSSTKSIPEQNVQKKTVVLTDEQMFEFKYQFFEANKYKLQGNYTMAINLFNNCLKIDSTSAAVNYSMAEIYLINKEVNLAQIHIEKAIESNSTNTFYLYLAGNIYLQNKNYEAARLCLNKLIALNGNEIDYYFNLADVYLQDNDLQGAIKVYDDIDIKFGVSEMVIMQKYKIYMSMNKKKEGLNELMKLENSFPDVVEYKRLVADYYVQVKNIDAAINKYLSILAVYENDGFSYIGLAECYRNKNDINSFFNYLEKAFKSEDVPSDVKFNLLLSIVQNTGNNPDFIARTFILSEILYIKYPKDADISLIYANFLLQKEEYEKARTLLIEVLETRKDRYQIWEQLVLLDNQFLDWDSMFKHSSDAIVYFPNQSFLYFFNGFSAFQLKNYEKAISSLSFGQKIITKTDPLYSDFLTFLGESYYKVDQKEKAYTCFDQVLENNSDNIMVLNNYAYYLSMDGMNLDKAESYSKSTLKMEPNNPTYLDTYAWILFKQKRYSESIVIMDKVMKLSTDSSDVVFEHYGDILYFNNMNDKALEYWIKAKQIGEGSGKLDEKIREKKYIE